jgi:hypothetical protein
MEEISKLKIKLNEVGTYPLITEVIPHYLKNWFRNEDTTYRQRLLTNIPIHQSLLQNIHDQTVIGWDHLVRGKMATSWTTTQTSYNPNTKKPFWNNKIITHLINVSNNIWEIRNTLTFGPSHMKQKGEQKKLEPIVLHYYSTYHRTVHPSHHHLFHTPPQTRITFSPQENKQWIRTVKVAMKIHKKKIQIKLLRKTSKNNSLHYYKEKKSPRTNSGTNTGTHHKKIKTQENIHTGKTVSIFHKQRNTNRRTYLAHKEEKSVYHQAGSIRFMLELVGGIKSSPVV